MEDKVIPFDSVAEDEVVPVGTTESAVTTTPPPDLIPFDEYNKPARGLYVEDQDQTYTYPADTNEDELEEGVQTEIYGKDKGNFLFGVDMGEVGQKANYAIDLLTSYGHGAAAFGVSRPMRLAASELLQLSEDETSRIPTFKRLPYKAAQLYEQISGVTFLPDILKRGRKEPADEVDRAMQEMSVKIIDKSNEILQNEFFQPTGDTTFEKIAYDVGGASASLMTAVALTWLTKTSSAAAVLFGDIAKGEAYLRARAEGKTPEEARRIGWQAFIVEGGLEKLGLDRFTRTLKGSKVIQRVTSKMTTEFLQEFGQDLGGEVVAMINGLETADWEDILKNAAYSGLIGLISGGVVGGVQVMKENRGLRGDLRRAGLSDEQIDEKVLPALGEALNKRDIKGLFLRNLATEYARIADKKYIKGKDPLSEDEKSDRIDPGVKRAMVAERMVKATLGDVPGEVTEAGTQYLNQKELSPEENLALQGRLNQIDAETQTLQSQLANVVAAYNMADDKAVRNRLENQIDELQDQIDAKDIERLALEIGPQFSTEEAAGEQVGEIKRTAKVSLKAGVLEHAKIVQAKKRLAKFKEGVKTGKTLAKNEVRSFQRYLVNMITASEALTPKQKEGMLKSMPSVQSEKKLLKKIDLLEARIAILETANTTKIFKQAVQTLLKKSVKKKFDVKTKELFDELVKLNREEGLDPAFFQEQYDVDNPEALLKYDVAMLKSPFLTLPQLQEIYFDLQRAYNDGVDSLVAEKRAAKAEFETNVEKIIDDITGGGKALKYNVHDTDQTKGMRGAKRTLRTGDLTLYSRLKILAKNSKSPVGQAFLNKLLNTFEARQTFETVYQNFGPRFREITQRIYGLKSADDAFNKWTRDLAEDKTLVWTVTDEATGKETQVSETLNRAELRKRWMEWQRPTGRRTLENKHDYTEDTIAQIESILTEQDMEFIKEQFRIYDEMYNLMSPLYGYLTGKPLPYEEFYSHLFTQGQNDPQSSVVDVMAAQGGNKGFFNQTLTDDTIFKATTGASSGLRNVPDIFAMEKYIRDVSYFMGYAELVQKMDKYLGKGSKDVRENIKYYFGEGMVKSLDEETKRLAAGGFLAPLNSSFEGFTKFTAPVIRAYLSNPVIGIKQTTAMFAYLAEMPTADFIDGLMDLPRAVASGDINKLVATVFMHARGNTFEREIAMVKKLAEDQGGIYGIDKKARFFDLFLSFMRMGDRASIYAGGWAMYKYDTQVKGMSEEEALRHFVEFTTATQQSTDVDQMPPVLTDPNPLARLLTVFKQAPYQYMNAMRVVFANAHKMPPTQVAKKLFVFHALLPMVFQFIANGFKWNWEDETRAAILGPFNDLIVIGDLLGALVDYIYAKAMDEENPQWRSNNDLVDSVAKSAYKTVKLVNQYVEEGGLDEEETLNLIRELATAVSPVGGTVSGAGRYLATAGKGFIRADEGEYVDALRNFLGYSDYVVERANEE